MKFLEYCRYCIINRFSAKEFGSNISSSFGDALVNTHLHRKTKMAKQCVKS